ncbi:MAG: efflux transporter outer membrane subunit [Gammaproteobacteria bacterium]|nr:efflux transporter outer membrane subunit [Gammaproteobacteria bacterium]
MRSIRITALVLISLSCLACNNLSKQELALEAIGEGVATPRSWQESGPDDTTTLNNWLESFNDPVLLELIAEGKANNIDLQVSAKAIEKAWLLAARAGSDLKPKLGVAAGRTQYGFNFDSYNKSLSYMDTGLAGQLELDVWGRVREGAHAAKMDVQAAQADYAFAQQSLSASIAKTYLKIIEAKQQAVITKKNQAILQETLRITRARYDNGLATGQDVALNSANLAAIEEHLLNVESAERDAGRALELLLGRYPGAAIDVAEALPALPLPPAAGLPAELLERRPDIIAAERSVAAAFNRSAQAKAAFLPRVILSNQMRGAARNLSDLFDPVLFAWKLAGTLTTPILDGGIRKIDSQIASVEQEQAVLNYAQLALQAFFEVENNLYLGGVLSERKATLSEVSRQSAMAYEISQIRYVEGEIDLLDTLTIQREAITAESSLVSIKRAQLDQQIDLYLSLGGNW